MHLHTYKFVKTVHVIQNLMRSTYEDWACVHESCNRMIRTSILRPPKRRIPEDTNAN
jgi:hypothetical protein